MNYNRIMRIQGKKNFNLLTALLVKTSRKRLPTLKHCNFLSCANIALTVSCEHWVKSPSNRGFHYRKKKSRRFLQNITFWIWTRKKMTVFNVIEKRQRSRFIAFRFSTEIIIAKPKVNIHPKIQSLFLLRSDFFVLFRFPGRVTAFCSSASWSCLDFQHHCYIAC